MIDKERVIALVEEKLTDRMFLVEVTVSAGNLIQVFIDSYDGITIDHCIEVSRHVEHSLDREEEDFGLEVSSPGLTEPFKVKQQFFKYTGREIDLVLHSGERISGLLMDAGEKGIVMETIIAEKPEGQKRKEMTKKENKYNYEEIKRAKAVISFNKLMSDGKY